VALQAEAEKHRQQLEELDKRERQAKKAVSALYAKERKGRFSFIIRTRSEIFRWSNEYNLKKAM